MSSFLNFLTESPLWLSIPFVVIYVALWVAFIFLLVRLLRKSFFFLLVLFTFLGLSTTVHGQQNDIIAAGSELTINQSTEKNKDDELKELRAEHALDQRQNELLQKRSHFTTGGIVMVFGIGAMLIFIVVNNRWRHRLEIKNQQLQRERNVVVAQNKQLAIERDRAEAASQAKTAFLRSISHEIRTPMNAISGFSQILSMSDLDIPEAERRDFSLRIQHNIRLLTNILDDLILISDTESGSNLPKQEKCIVSTLTALAEESVRPLMAPEVTFDSTCSVPDDELVLTHPRMIGLILSKLLDNAAKFTVSGSISLNVTLQDEKLHFTVTDTGPGIPADKREVVFDRFYKLDNFSQGAGLGLHVARMVAERIGGSLTLDGDYSGGSKFDLIIPISHQQ